MANRPQIISTLLYYIHKEPPFLEVLSFFSNAENFLLQTLQRKSQTLQYTFQSLQWKKPEDLQSLPMETDAEGQGDLKWMLCAIGLQVAAIIEEVLQARFDIESKVRRKVVLDAKAE